ncbi:cysteine hydrolase [Diaphorobacter ruginosibacter]|uniref:Cysteine hydrolase n=1 Tax=Diaphorobacter ruginosibacter TaxID=1715720 RepID=A0A7G9RJ54_9BURK|nr:isochorismatase family cysteine hydrolase [Diaphorobacter ruginosibacter]QNN55629.1 cysteine hydrolase [Diaphorobacter ruginosibacter]
MLRRPGLAPAPVPESAEVLLLVDVINPFHFRNAKALLKGASTAALHIARLRSRLRRRGVPVIYANDNYGTWDSQFSDILAACCRLRGERGAIARLLAPEPGDLVILKPQHSAFHSTPLLHLLGRMQARRLVIAGFATDMCVMLTAADARMSGHEVWVPSDCTEAEAPERKHHALRQLSRDFKCSVRSSQ